MWEATTVVGVEVPTPGPSGTVPAAAAGVGAIASRSQSVASEDVQMEDAPSEPDVMDPTLGIPLLPIGRPEKVHRAALPGKPPGLSARRPRGSVAASRGQTHGGLGDSRPTETADCGWC